MHPTRIRDNEMLYNSNLSKKMVLKKALFVLVFAVATIGVSAQKISGDISSLKNQNEVNLVLDLTEILVNNKAEEVYLASLTKGKKEEAKAQISKEWDEDLPNGAYSSLLNNINKEMSNTGVTVGDFPNAEYTIKVKVLNITVGSFPMKNSAVKADIFFTKKDETTPFATLKNKNALGRYSMNVPHYIARMIMSFNYLGGSIGSMVAKELK